MGIKSSIFKKYHLNYLNLAELSLHAAYFSKKMRPSFKSQVNYAPWIKVYFFNQEIQNQIYKNYIFSNHNHGQSPCTKLFWYSGAPSGGYTKDITLKEAKKYGLGLNFLIATPPYSLSPPWGGGPVWGTP